ncbi:MAG: hypothetical protein C7N36_14795 [Bacteroidetes bacterium]|nr:MAG: hypothetical protein C7N36_14795 [Bacteroidota bacterium]
MKKKQPQVIPEQIHLTSINIIKAHLETSDAFLENPVKAYGFQFGLAHKMAHNMTDNRSRCRLYFTLKAHDESENPIGIDLEYGIEFHFVVENLSDFILPKENDSFQMDAAIAATLLGMAYSTARGIVYERTRGTFLDGVLLPVIDPVKALVENNNLES